MTQRGEKSVVLEILSLSLPALPLYSFMQSKLQEELSLSARAAMAHVPQHGLSVPAHPGSQFR